MSKEPKRNVYVGHRYVPKIMGEWDKTESYEGLSIVTNKGTSYTSKKRVPKGIDILNEEYWVVTGNYNAQVETYRQEVKAVEKKLRDKSDITYVDDKVLKVNNQILETITDIKSRGVNVQSPVDTNLTSAKGDGITDDTTALQNILDNYDSVFIPDGTYMINAEIGLTMKDDQVIEFGKNAWIKNKEHDLTDYQMIDMSGVNQTLLYPKLNGNRYENNAIDGEHGHGINMRGAINPKVIHPEVINCWGDGIYIGTGSPHWCENVYIDRPICDNNRRQGISVTSVKGLRIINPIIKNTNGTDPQAGIDLEPNNPESHMEDVRIINARTENNANQGIIIALNLMTGSKNMVDITIENPHCIDDSIALAKCNGNLEGRINIINPITERAGIEIRDYDVTSPEVNIINPIVIDQNVEGREQEKYASGIVVFYDTNDNTSETLGNVNIYDASVIDTGAYPKTMTGIYVRNASGLEHGIEKVNIYNPKRIDSLKKINIDGVEDSTVVDDRGILTGSFSSGLTVKLTNFYKKITNKNIDSAKNYTLEVVTNTSPEITFEMVNEHAMILNPRENEVILPISDVAGESIRSDTAGSSLTLKKINATTWLVTNIIGTWT